VASLGIDIGSFSIKVAKVKSSSRGYDLIGTAEYPLTQDPTKDQTIDVIEAIREIKNKMFEEGDTIVIGAHQFDLTTRRRQLPFRERHKILKSLPFELEDDIPFSFENAIFDAKITHYVGNTAHLLAFVSPKEHLIQIIKRVTDAGIEPNIVSADGVGFSNLFEAWRDAPWEYPASQQELPEESPVDIILNIGHKSSTLSVIKNGHILDLRQIDWGGKDLAELISAKYNLHYLEALKELRRKGFILTNNEGATRDQVALSEVIKSSVDNFAQKLRYVLYDLKNQYNLEFKQMILTGGVSQLRNLGPYLTQKLEVVTNRLGHLDLLPQLDFANSPNNENSLVTAIGLGLEGLRRPKNPALNLLRGEFAKQSETLRLFWEKWHHAVQVGAIAFLVFTVWAFFREGFSETNLNILDELFNNRTKQILGGKRSGTAEQTAKNYIREQKKKIELQKMLESLQDLSSAMDITEKISAVAPNKNLGGLNVRTLNILSDEVHITGEASRAEVVTELMNKLKSISADGNVSTGNSINTKNPGYKAFDFKIKIKRRG
jgi:general secretion pathway protein L